MKNLKLKHVFMIKNILSKLVKEEFKEIFKEKDKQEMGISMLLYILNNDECEKPIYDFIASYKNISVEEAVEVDEDELLIIIDELIESGIVQKLKKVMGNRKLNFLAKENILSQ
jgi:hypothetical protein